MPFNSIVKFFILITLFSSGCQSEVELHSLASLQYYLTKVLMGAEEISTSVVNGKFSQKEGKVTPGIPFVLLSGISSDLVKPIKKKFCLFFQRPFKESDGKMWLSFVDVNDECAIDVDSFYSDKISEVEINTKVPNKPFSLSLKIKAKNEQTDYTIPMVNLRENLQQKYAESERVGAYSPSLNLVTTTSGQFKIGSADDSFQKKSAKKCHNVNEECETVGENLCHLCRYGWYEVADFSCPQGSSKFCGENKCGEKGEPACPSGAKVYKINGPVLCYDDSEAGFCQGELRPVCNEQNILICR